MKWKPTNVGDMIHRVLAGTDNYIYIGTKTKVLANLLSFAAIITYIFVSIQCAKRKSKLKASVSSNGTSQIDSCAADEIFYFLYS